jgi:NDP-sugar pyrophosphorylase family protein
LVLNADILTDLNVARLMQRHCDGDTALTLATRPLLLTIRYGVIETQPDGTVSGIQEKPTMAIDISAGMYVVSRDAIAPLLASTSGALDMPDLVKMALANALRVRAEPSEGRWFDIGEEGELQAAREAFAKDPTSFLDGSPASRQEGRSDRQ